MKSKTQTRRQDMEKLELTEFLEDLSFLCSEGLLALRCEETNTKENIEQKFLNIKKLILKMKEKR